MSTEALHIIELRIANVKRIRAAKIRPDGSLVIVGGKNAQGKTSVLDAVAMALGGGKVIPAEPLRRGARKGEVVVDLGEYVIERTFTAKSSSLEVRDKTGAPIKSPQKVLDALCPTHAFDPCAFARMETKQQDEVLRRLLKLDFADLDSDRAKLYEARTDVGRELKRAEARLDALPPPEAGVPDQELSAAELDAEQDRRRAILDANERARLDLENSEARVVRIDEDASVIEARISDLKSQLALQQQKLDALVPERAKVQKDLDEQRKFVATLTDPDLGEVKRKLAELDATNRKVRQNAERNKLEAEVTRLADRTQELTGAIDGIDEKKQEAIANAKFPVPGLGFDANGPTLNGLPLEQASGAEKMRVSVAIGAALNPRVRVMLVRDGSLLDKESLALLEQLAKEQDCQVLLERVGDDDEGAIVIEDGMVRADENGVETDEAEVIEEQGAAQ